MSGPRCRPNAAASVSRRLAHVDTRLVAIVLCAVAWSATLRIVTASLQMIAGVSAATVVPLVSLVLQNVGYVILLRTSRMGEHR